MARRQWRRMLCILLIYLCILPLEGNVLELLSSFCGLAALGKPSHGQGPTIQLPFCLMPCFLVLLHPAMNFFALLQTFSFLFELQVVRTVPVLPVCKWTELIPRIACLAPDLKPVQTTRLAWPLDITHPRQKKFNRRLWVLASTRDSSKTLGPYHWLSSLSSCRRDRQSEVVPRESP